MQINYLIQPDSRFGDFLMPALAGRPFPRRIVVVSAFVALQTVMRLKLPLLQLRDSGSEVSLVIGLDMGGTSKEVLRQISTWNLDITIVKNRIPGHTFHPKIYLLEWGTHARIITGSNNATEGGFYRNYEAAVSIKYDFPVDSDQYATALRELARFIQPQGSIARRLTPDYLTLLLARADIPTEVEARARTASQFRRRGHGLDEEAFGSELISSPPPLSADLLADLVQKRRNQRRAARAEVQGGAHLQPEVIKGEQIAPAAFYMSLPTLQGPNIPGEARIPLDAIEVAEDFWGWPEKYVRRESPRAGQQRIYHDWKPIWRIWNVEREDTIEQPVRMYFYENSSDFRFYARPLVTAGGDLGDIVRIVRVAEPVVEFECALARVGTAEHRVWEAYCTTAVRNSPRRFGYG